MIDSANLDGKIALVAGVPAELAEATARRFATQGAAGLVICGRSAERGQAVAAIISAAGCPAHFLPADLARPQDCAAAIADADQVFGRIDVLVTGSGAASPTIAGDATAEQFDHAIAADLRAPFLLVQGAAGLMRRRGNDGAVVVAIGRADETEPRTPLSAACAGALASMAVSFHTALIGQRIRVYGLLLGGTMAPHHGQTGVAAVAQAIARLAAPGNPTAPGSIVDLASLHAPEPALA